MKLKRFWETCTVPYDLISSSMCADADTLTPSDSAIDISLRSLRSRSYISHIIPSWRCSAGQLTMHQYWPFILTVISM